MIRTVMSGKVRVKNNVYVPDKRYEEYGGQLDGVKCLFSSYRGEDMFIYCNGPVDEANTSHIINGTLPWMFWYKEY